MTTTDRETAAAQDDYLNLFAAYDSLKRDYTALQRHTDSAIDTLQAENAVLRELAHCVYAFREGTGRAEAYPGEHPALKRQLWGAHDHWLQDSQ